MDRVDLLRVFTCVVDMASFTRAASMLDMPRSSVSAAIRELEERLGARLLARTTRTVTPTPDGEAFYAHAQRLVMDMEEAESLFRPGAAGVRGMLRVNLPARLGRLVVAPALPDFLAVHPAMQITLGMTDRPINLTGDGVDCALRVGALRSSGLVARPMGELTLVNVASPAYLARHGMPPHPETLAAEGHEAVLYASATLGRVEPWEWQEAGATHLVELPGRVTVECSEAQIACCLAGLGLIQVPLYDVRAHLVAGDLVEVLPHWRAAPMPMALLYPHRRHLSARLRVFADWLHGVLSCHVLDT